MRHLFCRGGPLAKLHERTGPLRPWEMKIRKFQATELGCFLVNLVPNPAPCSGTTWWQAFVCRWFHRGTRCSSGMPSASKVLTHDIGCARCRARYEIIRPNTPQYSTKMPFQKPDRARPRTWAEWREKEGQA